VKLQEYRSKEILARHGVPLLAGEVATSPTEARAAAQEIGGPVVVKAQVLVGGRGKAGGVKLAATPDEAEQRAREIIGLDIKGTTVKTVLVAPASSSTERARRSPSSRPPRAASRSRRPRGRTPTRSCGCRSTH
jgi:succinyl-CoA synthetase beta subunit